MKHCKSAVLAELDTLHVYTGRRRHTADMKHCKSAVLAELDMLHVYTGRRRHTADMKRCKSAVLTELTASKKLKHLRGDMAARMLFLNYSKCVQSLMAIYKK